MHLNAASIVVLVTLGIGAATLKIFATVKVSRAGKLPKIARIVFVLRTVFFFLVVAVGLDHYLLPATWQYPAFGFKLFLTVIGIWIALVTAFPILLWRHRKIDTPKQIGVNAP
ncbi:MAG: hypothetical protein WBD87_17190 [Candidatus Acidiferrales bacterium]